jgi:hypothetical protein
MTTTTAAPAGSGQSLSCVPLQVEGIVGKLASGRYHADGTSTNWCKIKNPGYTQMTARHELFEHYRHKHGKRTPVLRAAGSAKRASPYSGAAFASCLRRRSEPNGRRPYRSGILKGLRGWITSEGCWGEAGHQRVAAQTSRAGQVHELDTRYASR